MMMNKFFKLCLVATLLSIIFLPLTCSAKIELVEQIFTFEESGIVHCEFFWDVINETSTSTWLHKTMGVSNLQAYDFNTTASLDFEVMDNEVGKFITIDHSSHHNLSESYRFILKFDREYYELDGGYIYSFPWSWGNTSYEIPLRYIFKLPPLYIEDFYNGTGHKNYIEKNQTVIIFEDNAPINEYFKVDIKFKKINPPRLTITKSINKASIQEGDPVTVTIKISNFYRGVYDENLSYVTVARNIEINPSTQGIFEIEVEDESSRDLPIYETMTVDYTMRAIGGGGYKNK